MSDYGFITDFFWELMERVQLWIKNEILTTAFLIEVGVVFLVLVFSRFLTGRIKNSFSRGLKLIKILTEKQRERMVELLLYPFVVLCLLWICLLIGGALGVSFLISNIIINLFFAWFIIKLISILLPRETLSVKILFFLVWVVVVLNILGIYQQIADILEGITFSSGNISISLMNIIRGVLLFVFLYWLQERVNILLKKRIKEASRLTPSIKVLLNKVIKTFLFLLVILITLSGLGVDLSSFAFLGGAVGVGLGFGLQKIVSNYISGIIILLDKSVKPGDIIEVDNVFGRIKSQETRFVSLVTRSGKEYLIPNETFITNQVINWSYSDDLVRLEVEVGVSYNSDLKLVRELLLQAVAERERVLTNPEPVCLLKEFGDNTVNFQLRFWINDPGRGVANIRSEVMFSIWELLSENDIQISYPQRDLHFKSFSPEMLEAFREVAADGKRHSNNSGSQETTAEDN